MLGSGVVTASARDQHTDQRPEAGLVPSSRFTQIEDSHLQGTHRDYEATKAMELVKVQLATRSGAVAVPELTEAERLLRRLRETTNAAECRKLASQLDMAMARLHIVANTP